MQDPDFKTQVVLVQSASGDQQVHVGVYDTDDMTAKDLLGEAWTSVGKVAASAELVLPLTNNGKPAVSKAGKESTVRLVKVGK